VEDDKFNELSAIPAINPKIKHASKLTPRVPTGNDDPKYP
jgi:hypothetical protein